MATSNTVVALKSAFLRAQSRILSQPLQPEQGWVDGQRGLDAEAVKEVVREVNRRVKRHTRTVYPISSMRHIAEQIDKLYWDAGAPDLEIPDEYAQEENNALAQHDDLTMEPNIAKLPTTWPDVSPAETEAYEALYTKLTALSRRRKVVKEQLARYIQMQESIKPLRQPAETVQPNLVTRDGPLRDELAKLRSLSVRLSARIGVMQAEAIDARTSEHEELVVEGSDAKIRDVVLSM